MANPEGLSSADFRARAQAGTLKRNDAPPGPGDPLDRAIADRRKLAALKIVEQGTAEVETEALKAENERLKTLAEQNKLREELEKGVKGADDPWRDYLTKQVERLQEGLEQARAEFTAMQIGALQERLQQLSQEVERAKDTKEESPSNLASLREAVQEAQDLLDLVRPSPPPATDSRLTQEIHAWETMKRLEQERWQAERQDRHQERLAEIQNVRDSEAERLAMQRESQQLRDRFLTETVPNLFTMGQKLLNKWEEIRTAIPPARPATLPPDIQTITCTNCETQILYREGWPRVFCSYCGAEYRLTKTSPPGEEGTTIPQMEEGSL